MLGGSYPCTPLLRRSPQADRRPQPLAILAPKGRFQLCLQAAPQDRGCLTAHRVPAPVLLPARGFQCPEGHFTKHHLLFQSSLTQPTTLLAKTTASAGPANPSPPAPRGRVWLSPPTPAAGSPDQPLQLQTRCSAASRPKVSLCSCSSRSSAGSGVSLLGSLVQWVWK